MFIAHLPAGYLVTRVLWPRLAPITVPSSGERKRALAVGLAASLAPDLDLFWFYFVDGGRTHHHHFFPHLPAVWLLGGALAFGLTTLWGAVRRPTPSRFLSAQATGANDEKDRSWLAPRLVLLATACGLVHLLLDTVVGHIKWGWPVTERMVAAFDVPARGGHWIMNFVLHWSFALELVIVAVAMGVAIIDRWRQRGETLGFESRGGADVAVSSPHDD